MAGVAVAAAIFAAGAAPVSAAERSVTVTKESCGSTASATCLAANRLSVTYPFAIAVLAATVGLDAVSLWARAPSGTGSFVRAAATSSDAPIGGGSMWEIDEAGVVRHTNAAKAVVEQSGFDLRLRFTTMGGKSKTCPKISFRKRSSWQVYDTNKSKWVSFGSGQTFTAFQTAIKVPLKGVACK